MNVHQTHRFHVQWDHLRTTIITAIHQMNNDGIELPINIIHNDQLVEDKLNNTIAQMIEHRGDTIVARTLVELMSEGG